MDALISVVIPTYNHAKFLKRALQSVLDQTYRNWEALVVDNHSQDNTGEVLQAIIDPRITTYQIHNSGVIAGSRNLGISKARGDWVAFLDSDDLWYPDRLETVMAAILQDDCDVICNDEFMVNQDSGQRSVLSYGLHGSDSYRELLLGGNQLSTSATVVRRDFLLRHGLQFDEAREFITVEDYSLWLELAHAGARFRFISRELGEFSIHDANTSSRYTLHRNNMEALLHEHVFNRQTFASSSIRLWKQIAPRLHFMDIRNDLSQGKTWRAVVRALMDFLRSPFHTSAYMLSKIRGRVSSTVR